MKKFLSMVTAFSCVTSLISVLPASADEERLETFIVIAMSDPETPQTYVISDTNGYTFWVGAKPLADLADGQYFTVGDVLNFSNIGYSATEKVGTNQMWLGEVSQEKNASVTKTGSLFENAEIAEFTVSDDAYHYRLNDDENSYWFYLDWGTASYWQPDKYEYDFLQDGDKVSCYTYEGKPYIMINDSQEDYFENYLYLGSDGEKSILMNEDSQTYYLDTETFNSYLRKPYENFTPFLGMVFRFRNLTAPEYEMPLTPLGTVDLTLSEISKKSAPVIAFHNDVNTWAKKSTKFEVVSSDVNIVTLAQDGKAYPLRTDFLTDTYISEQDCQYFMNQEQILNQETVSCLTWNGRPFIAVQEEAKDYLETAYVMGVDNPENPQQYVLKKDSKYLAVFTKEELAPYLPENTVLKTGDVLQLRNVFLVIDANNYHKIENYSDTSEGRPNQIEVSGSMLENLTLKEMTLWSKNPKYTRVRNENNKDFDLYPAPEGFETFPVPDISGLKQGDKVTCLIYDNRVIALYDGKISPTGDADGNGELDILDIITVNKAVLGKETLSEDKISYVDFNGNGIPDADDALTMLKMLVGLL